MERRVAVPVLRVGFRACGQKGPHAEVRLGVFLLHGEMKRGPAFVARDSRIGVRFQQGLQGTETAPVRRRVMERRPALRVSPVRIRSGFQKRTDRLRDPFLRLVGFARCLREGCLRVG